MLKNIFHCSMKKLKTTDTNHLPGDPGFEKLCFGSPAGSWKKLDGCVKCGLDDEYDWLTSDSWCKSGTGLGSRERDSGVTSPLMPIWLGEAGADLC